jgi:hypothetical protein
MTVPLAVFLNIPEWLVPVGVVLTLLVVIGGPAWWALNKYIKPTTPEHRKEVFSLLLQTLGGVAFVLGGWFTWQQLVNSREELRTTQRGQITERFTRAVEQLGKGDDEGGPPAKGSTAPVATDKNLAIRLGGIYALEHISVDSEKEYYPTVMEVLTAYVRQHAAWAEGTQAGLVKPDIQAILTVLGRRRLSYGQGESQRLDLSATDLRNAALANANLTGMIFNSAHMEEANLNGARLDGTQLQDARLGGSFLNKAVLSGADMRGANLRGAHVAGADFSGADLTGVDLRGAEGLTSQQINSAKARDGLLTDTPQAGTP